jgi:hypothetical protein
VRPAAPLMNPIPCIKETGNAPIDTNFPNEATFALDPRACPSQLKAGAIGHGAPKSRLPW